MEEALRHRYMKEYHLPEDEPVARCPFNTEDNDDTTTKTVADWKGKEREFAVRQLFLMRNLVKKNLNNFFEMFIFKIPILNFRDCLERIAFALHEEENVFFIFCQQCPSSSA